MNEEKNNPNGIPQLLQRTRKAFEQDNLLELRKISNTAIEEVMITQQPKLVEVSLISYALSKLLSKPHYQENPKWEEFKEKILSKLKTEEETRGKKLEEIIETIYELSQDAGNYIENVVEHGRIKQASRLYALGISLDTAAKVTRVKEERLLGYIGATLISEKTHTISKTIEDRYRDTKKILLEEEE